MALPNGYHSMVLQGKLKVQMTEHGARIDANIVFGEKKADHNIINAALVLAETEPKRKVVLVSKDINLRLKAKSLNIFSEDYQTGKVQDIEGLYTGKTIVPNLARKIIDTIYKWVTVPVKLFLKTNLLLTITIYYSRKKAILRHLHFIILGQIV